MKKVTCKLSFTFIGALVLSGLVSQVNAQVTRFGTYNISYIGTAEGEYRPPIKLAKINADELDRFWDVTKDEKAYMEDVISSYVGKKTTCNLDLYFLPGATESEFRSAEKIVSSGVVKTGFTSQTTGKTTRYVLKKSSPIKKFSNGSVSLYLYESVDQRNKRSAHVHAYIYSQEAKQGNLMMCNAYV